jgi:hypothetical protein
MLPAKLRDPMTLFTAILAVATIVLAFVSVLQWLTLEKTDETMRAAERPFIGIDPNEITINSPLTFGTNGPSFNFDMWLKNTGKSTAIHVAAIVNGLHIEPFMPSGILMSVKDLINLYSKGIDCNKSTEREYPGWGTIILPGARAKQTFNNTSFHIPLTFQPDPRTGQVSVFFPICIIYRDGEFNFHGTGFILLFEPDKGTDTFLPVGEIPGKFVVLSTGANVF